SGGTAGGAAGGSGGGGTAGGTAGGAPTFCDAGTRFNDAGTACVACPLGFLRCRENCCPARALTGHWEHYCALSSTDEVVCWGLNEQGQLGRGVVSPAEPVQASVPLNLPVISVAVGATTSCAVLNDRSLWCWGSNSSGQGGDAGATPSRRMPPNSAEVVEGGNDHMCIITPSGSAGCFGYNLNGNVVLPASATSDFRVAVAAGVQQLSSGVHHNCVTLSDAGVTCWGDNVFRQARADGGNPVPPSPYPQLGAARQVAAASKSSCVLRANDVWCVGAADAGFPVNTVGVPELVQGSAGAATIAASFEAHCLTFIDGGSLCWTTAPFEHESARRMNGGPGPLTSLAVGIDSVCGIAPNGAVKCWGQNTQGSVGRDAGFTALQLGPDFIDP
ncbi:MAG: hypothetical protein JNK82_20865, partial [Myxococcaceae bacterium]|nr:hypothetical protein [Myxococcaceae bacterium]